MPGTVIHAGYISVSSEGLVFNGGWDVADGPPVTMTAQDGATISRYYETVFGIRHYSRPTPVGLKVYFEGSIALIPNIYVEPPTDNPLIPADAAIVESDAEANSLNSIFYAREFGTNQYFETMPDNGTLKMTATSDQAKLTIHRLIPGGTKTEVRPVSAGDVVYICGHYIVVSRKDR